MADLRFREGQPLCYTHAATAPPEGPCLVGNGYSFSSLAADWPGASMSHDAQLNAAQAQQAAIYGRTMHALCTMMADDTGPLAGTLQQGLHLLHMGVHADAATRQLTRRQAALAAGPALPATVGNALDLRLPLSDKACGHLYLQLQIAAIVARLYGFSLRHGAVRSLCFFALCYDMADADLLRMAGLDPDGDSPTALVAHASSAPLRRIDRYLIRRLLAGFVRRDQRDHPFNHAPGARTGGMFDGAATHAAGQKARQVFRSAPSPNRPSTTLQPVAPLNGYAYHA